MKTIKKYVLTVLINIKIASCDAGRLGELRYAKLNLLSKFSPSGVADKDCLAIRQPSKLLASKETTIVNYVLNSKTYLYPNAQKVSMQKIIMTTAGVIVFLLVFSYVIRFEVSDITGAYVDPTKYRTIELKIYDTTQEEECLQILDSVSDEYLEGLRVIKIQSPQREFIGHYYENGVLELHECSVDAISHELAHHRQHVLGDSSLENRQHQGRFAFFEREIFEDIWQNQGNGI